MTPRSRVWFALPVAVLALYAAFTLWYTIHDVGWTVDETFYLQGGQEYLRTHRFGMNFMHPPFSQWFGALAQNVGNNICFRYPHALLYLAGGSVIAGMLLFSGFELAAVVFAGLFFLCPNLKTMGSLHITDSDLSVFLGLASTLLWRLWRFPPASGARRAVHFGCAAFFIGMAAVSKQTGVLLLPLLGGVGLLISRRGKLLPALVPVGLVGLLLAFALAYHFRLSEIHWYLETARFRVNYNEGGHPSFLFGQVSYHGFWYYYLVVSLFKTPPPILLLVGLAFVWAVRRWRAHGAEITLFFLPALTLFILGSIENVHIGLRHLLPGILLSYIGASIVIHRKWANAAPLFRRYIGIALGAALTALVATDFHTLRTRSYLSYFNFMAPTPTRYFADSIIDWEDGIPRHLLRDLPPLQTLNGLLLSEAFSRVSSEPIFVEAGATSLCGFWSKASPLLKAFPPDWVVAGHEIHPFDQAGLFDLFRFFDQRANIDEEAIRAFAHETQAWRGACPKPRAWKVRPLPSPARVGAVIPPGPERLLLVRSDAVPGVTLDQDQRLVSHLSYTKAEWRVWIPAGDRKRALRLENVSVKQPIVLVEAVCE
jgi:hypothetical protein